MQKKLSKRRSFVFICCLLCLLLPKVSSLRFNAAQLSSTAPCLPPDSLSSSGAGNTSISSGFFVCCECTLNFFVQYSGSTGISACIGANAYDQGVLFVGDNPTVNSLSFYVPTELSPSFWMLRACDSGLCTNVTGLPYTQFETMMLTGVKQGNTLNFYSTNLISGVSLSSSVTLPNSNCLLVSDTTTLGSRIAADMTYKPGSCSDGLKHDTVSYYDVALDASEVSLLYLTNWMDCGFRVSKGTWLFENPSWSAEPYTLAGTLGMDWNNPCGNYSASVGSDNYPTATGTCQWTPSPTTTLFPTTGGTLTISTLFPPNAFATNVTLTTEFGDCVVQTFNSASVVCNLPSGIGANNSLSLKVFSGNILFKEMMFSYIPPSISSVTPALLEGGNITITGLNFGNLPNNVSIWINGTEYACSIQLDHTQLQCTVPSASSLGANGPVSFTLVVGNQATTGSFVYVSPSPTMSASSSITASVTPTLTPTVSSSETATASVSESTSISVSTSTSTTVSTTISETATVSTTLSDTATVSTTVSETATVSATISETATVSTTASASSNVSATISSSSTVSVSFSSSPSPPTLTPPPPPPSEQPSGPLLAQCRDGTVCDDGNKCTTDICTDAGCTFAKILCDDLDVCTVDSCNPTDGCRHESQDSSCGEISRECESYSQCSECAGDDKCGWVVCDPPPINSFNNFTSILLNNQTETNLVYTVGAGLDVADDDDEVVSFRFGNMKVYIVDQPLDLFGRSLNSNGECVAKEFAELDDGCEFDNSCKFVNLLKELKGTILTSVGVTAGASGCFVTVCLIAVLYYRRKKVQSDLSAANHSLRGTRTQSFRLGKGQQISTSENKAYVRRNLAINPLFKES